jgi:hypothetical protein
MRGAAQRIHTLTHYFYSLFLLFIKEQRENHFELLLFFYLCTRRVRSSQ